MGMRKQQLARTSLTDLATCSFKERRLILNLQLMDMLANSGLANEQFPGRFREA